MQATVKAASRHAPPATPTPIPALTPVDRPEDGCDALVLFKGTALLVDELLTEVDDWAPELAVGVKLFAADTVDADGT